MSMRVHIAEHVFELQFKHDPAVTDYEGNEVKAWRTTTATLRVKLNSSGEWVIIASGVAMCHPDDNFDKAKGRKLALDRLLRGTVRSFMSKDFRRAIWLAYWEQTGKNYGKPRKRA